MNIIAISRKGTNKTENEDRVIIGKNLVADGTIQTELTSGIVAVADGVGGNNAGAVASHFVASRLTNMDDVSAEILSTVNDDLLNLSSTGIEYRNMATTLSGLLVGQDKTYLFSIGNTRVYLLQGGKYLKQLTSDDTTLNYLLAAGQISAADSESFDRKNEITACFGGGFSHLFKMKCNEIEQLTSPFVMTSDGIHDYLTVDQIEDAIADHGISVDTCESLIRAARESGSHDDISIVLGEV